MSTPTRLLLTCAFTLSLASGCAHPQLPYQFALPGAVGSPLLDRVVRLLAAQGQEVDHVDPAAGVVYTRWKDTGFMFGQVQGSTANIVRRYLVVVTPRADGAQVLVRVEAQRCGRALFSIGEAGPQGACEEMNGVVPPHQRDLETLGTQLQSGLQQGG
jgi:hypothetical protein